MGGNETPVGITVRGEGRISGTPDTLTLSVGIGLERDSVAEATADGARLATGLIAALTAAGVDEADIQTSNYSIHPVYDWRNDMRRLIGYRVSNEVRVKIRNLDQAGEIIDTAASRGGNEVVVSGASFGLEDDAALVTAARRAAWTDATAKADQLAGLAGVSLGSPTAISESFAIPAPTARHMELAAEAATATTPVQPGELEVGVNIEVTFGLG